MVAGFVGSSMIFTSGWRPVAFEPTDVANRQPPALFRWSPTAAPVGTLTRSPQRSWNHFEVMSSRLYFASR